MQAEFDYLELLDSAQSVLRGMHTRGTLARIADLRARRSLAAAFMHRDVNTLVPVQWQVSVRAALAGNTVVRRQAKSLPRAGLPDGFEPVCWYSWRSPRSMSDEVVRMRRQAAKNFTSVMFQAVWTAHSDEPAWRVRAAWEVLDAVDAGRKIIAPLARFLRVSRKAIKLSNKFHGLPLIHYGRMRRGLRAMQAMHAAGIPASDLMPEVDLAMRTAHADVDLALTFVRRSSCHFAGCVTREDVHATGRQLIRTLRTKVTQGKAGIFLRRQFDLESGWTARSLVSRMEIERESREMRHCVASYSGEVSEGITQVLALRRTGSDERLTAVFSMFGGTSCADGDELSCVDFGARENGPISVESLLALVELSQRLGVSELDMREKTLRIAE